MPSLTRIVPFFLSSLTVLAAGDVRPPLSFDPAEVEFGLQSQHRILARDIIVRNNGTDRIHIIETEVECGCTTPTLDSRDLAPGGATTLHVQFDTMTFSGDVYKEVRLKTTAGDAVLQLRAFVSPFPGWKVSSLPAVFPTTEPGKTASLDVTLMRMDDKRVRLVSAQSNAGWLSTDLAATDDERTFRLRLVKQADAPVGIQHASVAVKSEAPDTVVMQIPVVLPVVSRYRLTPNPVVLPVVTEGTEARLVFTISGWDQQEPPRVEAAPFNVVYLGGADGTHRYQISYAPPRIGSYRHQLRVWCGSRLEIDTFAVSLANAAQQDRH